jgi:hypothetical protein
VSLRNRQTASKREDVIANKGKTCGVLVTGNGAEHTDTGFTVCAANGGKHEDKLRMRKGEGCSHRGNLL